MIGLSSGQGRHEKESLTYSARRSKHQHLELLFYNESNSYHYGKFSFGYLDYTTGRSVSCNEFV